MVFLCSPRGKGTGQLPSGLKPCRGRSQPSGSALWALRLVCFDLEPRGRPSASWLADPSPRAGEGRGCSEAPPPLPPAPPACGAVRACADPHLGAAMMVGVLQRRRSPGARWARRAGGGRGGRGGLALMSRFVSPRLRPLPRRAGRRQPRRKAWTTAPTSSPRRTAE